MSFYKVLNKNTYTKDNYSIVPIRIEDRYAIMKWRNEQLFHLRQNKPLTKEEQDVYFDTIVSSLFSQDNPNQILFSYLKGETCIGYGGLVHINWIDQNAEISFIIDTSIKKKNYEFHMSTFLSLLEEVAFKDLNFHKIFTFAFDVRPEIYPILEKSGYNKEAVLKEHCCFNGEFKDVVLHAKFNMFNKL